MTRTTTYFAIPLLATFKPTSFFTLLAGPQFSFLLKQRDVFANGTTSIAQETLFMNENIRRNILGFTVGFDVNSRHWVLGGRAGWDVQNNNGDGSKTTPRYNNAWLQATFGYRLYNF